MKHWKFGRSYEGKGLYLVMRDEDECDWWKWLFSTLLKRSWVCYGGYCNAWKLW